MNLPSTPLFQYQSYLLRVWRDEPHPEASSPWRFSLEDPRTGVRRGFQNLELLMTFLNAQINESRFQDLDHSEGG